MCWVQWVVGMDRCRWQQRLLMAACAVLGLLGSLLSQTRGGWLALALCMLPLSWFLVRHLWGRRVLVGGAGLLALVALLCWYQAPQLEQRWEQAQSEVSGYVDNGNARTSVGQRLDHWQLAWNMGLDRPWAAGASLATSRRNSAVSRPVWPSPSCWSSGTRTTSGWTCLPSAAWWAWGLLLFYGVPSPCSGLHRQRVLRPDGARPPGAVPAPGGRAASRWATWALD